MYIRQLYQESQELPLELFGEYKWGEEYKISKVSYENGIESFKFGNDTNNNLWINQENMYIVEEKQIENIYNKLNGFTAYSFEGKVIIDPALDVGDKMIIDGKPVIYQGDADFQSRFVAEINSKISIKQKQETTVKKQSQKVINRRVQSRIEEAEGKITQLVQETEENSEKLTKVEQTVDGIKETVSSVETKVEEVESTANTANTNATQAQNTANEAKETAEITTKKVTEVEKTVDGISQNVEKVETTLKADYSTTEETNSKIEQEAGKITNSVTEKIENIQVGGTNLVPNSAPYNLEGYGNYGTIKKELIDEKTSPSGKALKITAKTAGSFGIYIKPTKDIEIGKQYSYSVWIKTNRAMKLSVGHEKGGTTYFDVTTQWKKYTYTYEAKNTSEYSSFLVNTKTAQIGDIIYIYSIKLEEGNKVTAWSPAPEDDVKGFEFGTKIEQNAKNVQVAWNNESQNIRIENDGGNSTMGFYDNDTKFAEMGVNNVDNNKYISFAVPCDYNKRIADGMAWGVQTPDGKFHPVLFIKNFEMGNEQSDATYGQLELSNCDLVIGGNHELGSGGAIVVGNITMAGDPLGGLSFIDDMGKYLFTINKGDGSELTPYDTIKILNGIQFYRNKEGSNSFKIGKDNNKYCLFTDNGSAHCSELAISDGTNGVFIDADGKVSGNHLNFYGIPSYQENKLVYGRYGHDYHLIWTGEELQFWVDTTNVTDSISDRRLKSDIKDVDESLIKAINELEYKQFKRDNKNGLIGVGIIAQDLVEKLEKYGIKTDDYEILKQFKYKEDDDTLYYEVEDKQFLLLRLIAKEREIKELQEKIKQQDELIQDLIKRVEKLEKGEQNGT